MQNISLIAAIKNNIDYTKKFYETTRLLYPDTEICFVSHNSTDGTHEWLENISKTDKNLQIHYDNETRCFADTYNKAAQIATKDYIAFVHNDMILYSNFLENLSKHLTPNNIVSYTTVEPPIFGYHVRPGKLISDCGPDLENFDADKFDNFAKEALIEYKDKTQDGIVFFMGLSRELFLSIGGFDNLFNPFFREDDDLIKRLKMLQDKKYFTCLDAMCYHFVSKTSRFSKEYSAKSQAIENNNTRNYIRKWGSVHNENVYPISIVIKNCSIMALEAIEPYGQNIYIESNDLINEYINSEQQNTKISLKNKLHHIGLFNTNITGVSCIIDCNSITNADIQNITNIPQIVDHINKIGTYKIDNAVFIINHLNTIQKNKIIL